MHPDCFYGVFKTPHEAMKNVRDTIAKDWKKMLFNKEKEDIVWKTPLTKENIGAIYRNWDLSTVNLIIKYCKSMDVGNTNLWSKLKLVFVNPHFQSKTRHTLLHTRNGFLI